MKRIKKYNQFFENKGLASKIPTYSSSDSYIADVLDKLDINYQIGKDNEGNEGVFIITLNHNDMIEIHSTHPDKNHSVYNIKYSVQGEDESFKTHDLEKSLTEIIDSYSEDGEYIGK